MKWLRIFWGIFLLLGLVSLGIVMKGFLRDSRAGDPAVEIDLARPSDWAGDSFRVWGASSYRLVLSNVYFGEGPLGAVFEGEVEMRVIAPGGEEVLRARLAAGERSIVLAENYESVEWGEIALDDWPFRSGRLEVRVVRPDLRFAGGAAKVELVKRRYDPGMGGMLNYVFIFPAMVFILLALVTAVVIAARGGGMIPLAISSVAAAGMASFWIA